MIRIFGFIFFSTLCLVSITVQAQEKPNRPSAGMLRYPDVSAENIVFSYAGDLWIVKREGGVAEPLASPPGNEMFAKFSPDGKTIAFVGDYDGSQDIYTTDANGGIPQRITYHPASKTVCGWTTDNRIVFSTNGLAGLERQPQLFTVAAEKPLPIQLPVPYGNNADISPDGKWLAYTPHSHDHRTWKRYRGGMASDVWLFNLETKESRQMTDWEGTDSLPMFHDETVYYLSDAGPEHRLNIWSYKIGDGSRKQITSFKDYDCKWPSIGPGSDGKGEIVLENGSSLYLVALSTGEGKKVDVIVPGDKPKLRPLQLDVSKSIESADISPNAKRIVVETRGDLWTLPAKEGTPRNLTRTNRAAERSPAWSPDGRWIAYFSDETGEYELYIKQSDGLGETKQLTKDGKAFRYSPTWSPDSKHLVFTDKTGAIFLHTIDGETKLIDTEPFANQPEVNWSQDSAWLTYAMSSDNRTPTSIVYIYDLAEKKRHEISNGFFSDEEPVFDRKGDFLYFVGSRAFNQPQYEDVGSTFVYSGTQVILAVPLRNDVKPPMMPKNDEEEWGEKANEKSDDKKETSQKDKEEKQSDMVSGKWNLKLESEDIAQDRRNASVELKLESDGKVSGVADTPHGKIEITNGEFNSESKELKFKVVSPDFSVEVKVTISDNKLAGVAKIGDLEIPLSGQREVSSDEEQGGDAEKKADDNKKAENKPPVKIDFENIAHRTFQLPIRQGNLGSLAVNDKNQLVYIRRSPRGARSSEEGGGGGTIHLFDMHDEKKPEEKTVIAGARNFAMTADGKKLLLFKDRSMYVIDAAPDQRLEDEIPKKGMIVEIQPREEWKQIFREAWRIQRDFFYDPNMHGVDWQAIYDHYAKMIDDCSSRDDLGFLISEMISELNVGHAYYRPPSNTDSDDKKPDLRVGLIGCTFEPINGRYRIGTIFEGSAWDTDARNDLRALGVKEGDYLLAVNDIELTDVVSPYALFRGTVDTPTVLTIGDNEKLGDSNRRVVIKPMASDGNLRFRHWIEQNRKMVEQKTDGRVGYVYVINTGVPGQNDLFRQFYGQMNKAALIIDDRWNGGGQIPTRFIELLNRPVTNYWAKRDGRDWTWPPDSHQGPKCMLINGMAGSGGDMFPALFRQNKLGKLIGMRTWGGLVGISGNPAMIDGSSVTAPTFAYYELDGTWGIEGHGVDPDIQVVDDPAKMQDQGDPQLEEAIKLMLSEIESNPYLKPDRPKYPDRSKFGLEEADR
jgi:tricorn protease